MFQYNHDSLAVEFDSEYRRGEEQFTDNRSPLIYMDGVSGCIRITNCQYNVRI